MTGTIRRRTCMRLLAIGLGGVIAVGTRGHHASAQPAPQWPNLPVGSGWPGVQPREWGQTHPVHANPTDFDYPQRDNAGNWHMTICEGATGSGSFRLPAPPRWGKPEPANDPAGGAKPHANWRKSTEGEEDTKRDIEGHTAGENDLSITYTNRDGTTTTVHINVRVIDCNAVRPPALKGR